MKRIYKSPTLKVVYMTQIVHLCEASIGTGRDVTGGPSGGISDYDDPGMEDGSRKFIWDDEGKEF